MCSNLIKMYGDKTYRSLISIPQVDGLTISLKCRMYTQVGAEVHEIRSFNLCVQWIAETLIESFQAYVNIWFEQLSNHQSHQYLVWTAVKVVQYPLN